MLVDPIPEPQNSRPDNFRWICLGVAVVFGLTILWQINSLKTNVTRSLDSASKTVAKANEAVTTINAQLPQIVAWVKKGTETLSDLAEGVA
jgi:ABC-type transporter Mla subunit MlaD